MKPRSRELLTLVVLWLLAVLVPILSRPLMPIDETRYVSVAWEMWLRGDLLVPRLNGEPYSDKPPLLFWLFTLGWRAFGVHEWWPRAVPPLFALLSLLLTARLARLLWPERPEVARFAPLMLLGMLLWTLFTSLVMLDMTLVFFVLLASCGMAAAWRGDSVRGWLLVALGVGLGALTKGPVVLLFTLPTALLAPWWARDPRPRSWPAWYASCASAFLGGATIVLSWAIPAGYAGGPSYRSEILWGQTTGRVVSSFAHEQPWWWYAPLLPLFLFPFSVWPPVWRAIVALRRRLSEPGIRFCVAWLLAALAAFTLISGKQPHYLLPILPAFALLGSRGLLETQLAVRRLEQLPPAAVILLIGLVLALAPRFTQHVRLPPWAEAVPAAPGIVLCLAALALACVRWTNLRRALVALTTSSILLVGVLHVAIMSAAAPIYDLRSIGRYLNALQTRGRPIAHVGKYYDQYHFVGRLERPLEVIDEDEVAAWVRSHLDGKVIMYSDPDDRAGTVAPDYVQPYRGKIVSVWGADAVLGKEPPPQDPAR